MSCPTSFLSSSFLGLWEVRFFKVWQLARRQTLARRNKRVMGRIIATQMQAGNHAPAPMHRKMHALISVESRQQASMMPAPS